MPSLFDPTDRTPTGTDGFHNDELYAVIADLRVKASVARNPDLLPYPIVDENIKIQLAIRTSQVILVPGAAQVLNQDSNNSNTLRNKGQSTEMLGWSYMHILKNRLAFRTPDTHRTMPNNEEQYLDELQDRMTEFRDNSEQLENQQLTKRDRARRRKQVALRIIVGAFLLTVGTTVGVVLLRIKHQAGSQHNDGDDNGGDIGGQGIEDHFEQCLMDSLYVSTRHHKGDLPQISAIAIANFTDNPGSYQRAAWCWLNEVDDFFDRSWNPTSVRAVKERVVLASIYYYLILFGNLPTQDLAKSNWLSDVHVCYWDFVACNSRFNTVTGLHLEKQIFNGPIPREIAELSELGYLRLHQCSLTGSIPSELFSLTKLVSLDLSLNSLDGTIPSEIAKIDHLQLVNLSDNNLHGQIPTPSFKNRLIIFDAEQNWLTGSLPTSLSNATSLVELNLGFNRLTGTIPDISQLTNLIRLSLHGNLLIQGSFPDISGTTNLEALVLSYADISGTIPNILWFLPRLRELDLSGTRLAGTIPLAIGILSTLDPQETLILAHSKISGMLPTELGNLSNLSYLDLSGLCQLRGTIPTELGRLSKLNYLELPVGVPAMTGTVPSDICDLLGGPDSELSRIYGPSPPKCDCCTLPQKLSKQKGRC